MNLITGEVLKSELPSINKQINGNDHKKKHEGVEVNGTNEDECFSREIFMCHNHQSYLQVCLNQFKFKTICRYFF